MGTVDGHIAACFQSFKSKSRIFIWPSVLVTLQSLLYQSIILSILYLNISCYLMHALSYIFPLTLEPSRIVITPNSQEVDVGETATFNCTGVGSYATITWIFDNFLTCNNVSCDSNFLSYEQEITSNSDSSKNLTIHSTLTVNTTEFGSNGRQNGSVFSVECRVEQMIPPSFNLLGENSSFLTNLFIISEMCKCHVK